MRASAGSRRRILMLLENSTYPEDARVLREATSLAAAGHAVAVVCPARRKQSRRENIDGVEVWRYPRPREGDGLVGYLWEYGYSLLAAFVIATVVYLRRGFDVIHAHNPPDTMFLVALPFRLFGVSFVFDHHDLSPEMYDAKFEDSAHPTIRRVLLFLESLSFRTADHVISVNESYRDIALGRGGKPPASVTVVRNGPDLDRVRPTAPDSGLRARAGTLIGYVGSMGQQDGVDHLIRALFHLRSDFATDDFLCVIVGEGSAVPSLRALVSELGLDQHVWFTGRVSDADLMSYLSTCDICVDPDPSNPFTDRSTMIKVMEYMALGKPVVAYDLPEHRRTGGETILYAEPSFEKDLAARMIELIKDPDRARRLGESGRRRVEESLAWVHQEQNLHAAYRRLAESRAEEAAIE